MNDLGIRELKAKASEILRNVRQQGRRYIITHRGRPVAVLSPVETPRIATDDKNDDSWQRLEDLGSQISQAWQSEHSSTEILSAMRH